MSCTEYDMWLDEFARKLDMMNRTLADKSMTVGLDCAAYFRDKSRNHPPILTCWKGVERLWSFKIPRNSKIVRRIEAVFDSDRPEITLVNMGTELVLDQLE